MAEFMSLLSSKSGEPHENLHTEDYVAATGKALSVHHEVLSRSDSFEEARTGHIAKERFGVGHIIMGIDIGGTSIKAAPVNTRTGELVDEKFVILTPKPATPDAVADVIAQMLKHFNWKGPVGVGIPAVVRQGQIFTAANIDQSWIGVNAEQLFGEKAGSHVAVVNDADAAGYAEMGFGAGARNRQGSVIMVTFGTGIGTAMFIEGILVPNMELGHLELEGKEAEKEAAGVLVKQLGLSWDQWADRVSRYLSYLERVLWPTLIWLPKVKLPNSTPIVAAASGNDAGIIGAALAALARAAYDETKRPQQVDVLCM
eukprot:jgi/Mesen1/2657/ME000167S01801